LSFREICEYNQYTTDERHDELDMFHPAGPFEDVAFFVRDG